MGSPCAKHGKVRGGELLARPHMSVQQPFHSWIPAQLGLRNHAQGTRDLLSMRSVQLRPNPLHRASAPLSAGPAGEAGEAAGGFARVGLEGLEGVEDGGGDAVEVHGSASSSVRVFLGFLALGGFGGFFGAGWAGCVTEASVDVALGRPLAGFPGFSRAPASLRFGEGEG